MFEWLNKIMEAVLEFFPRRIIVTATHRGVKWKFGFEVIELKPGVHWYWPLVSEVVQYPVARQTLKLDPQTLMTADRRRVVARGIVVYCIVDILAALGKQNFDVDDTIADFSQSCIYDLVTGCTLEEVLESDHSDEMSEAAQEALKEYGVEIEQVKFTDFCETRPIHHSGIEFKPAPVAYGGT